MSEEPRYVHTLDVAKLARRVANPNGFGYHPDFERLAAIPSAYCTDFLGLLGVNRVTRTEILDDFVPGHAELEDGDACRLRLRFGSGVRATWYVNSSMRIRETEFDFDHVEFEGQDFSEYRRNIQVFLDILNRQGLVRKYLIPNPFYEDELLVKEQMESNRTPVPVVEISDVRVFETSDHALLLYPDRAHGDAGNIARLVNLLDSVDYDWLAVEMLPTNSQVMLDQYISSAYGSPAFLAAEEYFCDYFQRAWILNEVFADPRHNHFMRMLYSVKERGKRVFAMEPDCPEFLLFRNGETRFGGAVRSARWMQSVPRDGRGIVLGGSAHFTSSLPINFQDFHMLRSPGFQVFLYDQQDA